MTRINREEANKLFNKLFDFKEGERVKRRRKVFYRDRYWWQYGKVIRTYKRLKDIVSVLWDGSEYACSERKTSLLKVRPYGKEKGI